MNPICLTAFPIIGRAPNWRNKCLSAAESCGYKAIPRGVSILVWRPENLRRINDSFGCVDGWNLSLGWLGPNNNGFFISPHRFYFVDGGQVPTSLPEWKIIDKNRPLEENVSGKIRGCIRLCKQISPYIRELQEKSFEIISSRCLLHKKTSVCFSSGSQYEAGVNIGKMFSKHGFYSAPEHLKIKIVAESYSSEVLAYKKEVESAFRRCGSLVSVSLDEFKSPSIFLLEKSEVPLIAVSGKRGEPLPKSADELIKEFEKRKIPFRLFSVDNKSMEWAAFDQTVSLLQAAGGKPYILKLPWPERICPPFILGVDLGHPQDQDTSWVVLSIVDHEGILLESWRCRQNRNETIRPDVLLEGLIWASKVMGRYNQDLSVGVLVLRDGRIHKEEKIDIYKKVLNRPMTFVEIVKYLNPELYFDGQEPEPVGPGVECVPRESTVSFITTTSPRLQGKMPRVLKTHVLEEWDELRLGRELINEVIIGLCYAPGLGMQPHTMPAPIYWADGIGAISENNHQFSGQKVTQVDMGSQ